MVVSARWQPQKLAAEDFGGEILGQKIEVISADHQNKPDIASSVARPMVRLPKVSTMIADGAASSAGFAILEVARQKNRFSSLAAPAHPTSPAILFASQLSFQLRHLCLVPS